MPVISGYGWRRMFQVFHLFHSPGETEQDQPEKPTHYLFETADSISMELFINFAKVPRSLAYDEEKIWF